MRLAPLGAFGGDGRTIGKYGSGQLWSLGFLMACFYATLPGVYFLGLGHGLRGCMVQHLRLVRYIGDELLIAWHLISETVLPRMIAKLEKSGASKSVVGW